MLSFASASNATVDTQRAVEQALFAAASVANRDLADCRLVVFHVTMGHDDSSLLPPIRALAPRARVVGCTCAGVIGREGANESMRAFAVMLVWGGEDEIAVAVHPHLDGANSRAASEALAQEITQGRPAPSFVMFLGSGIDIDCDACIQGIEAQLGPDTTIFGGTSADNMKGVASFQFVDDDIHEHAAVLVGFFDPTLRVATQASHGFVASGVELTVTRSDRNRVHELDGAPAWDVYTRSLGLTPEASPAETIPPGAVGVALPPALRAEYGDSHLLRVITHRLDDGTFLMPVACEPGTRLALMRRDEERIFANLAVMMRTLGGEIGGDIVAVFHADCGARGRLTLDRVAKDEIVAAMQGPLRVGGAVPPWLGMYGFGELARLGGRNTFHNYTTSLYVLYRP
jgi:hypothetical protein